MVCGKLVRSARMGASRVKAGDVLAGGKYRVERVLGTGGMGMVVAARHVQLGLRVALKFMLDDAMAEPENAARFAREARAAVQLQSPHTARVLDVGKLQNGEPYMVMEYLDGRDLDEVLEKDGPMQPEMAVGYLLQACEAFAEAHSLGMIHRDIKLKNLFLTKTVDGRALVKVLDFGLAKMARARDDISLTTNTAVFGSPQYMSPEQMRSAKIADERSDIWSMGVCLYELLTGRLPFDAATFAEVCAMVLTDPAAPPSRWAQGLPSRLDAVVLKCLAKDPNHRYQSVAELAYALEPWTTLEGSARRILHVMETVQKTDLPTVLNPPRATHEPVPEAQDQAPLNDAWEHARVQEPLLGAPPNARPRTGSAMRPLSVAVIVGIGMAMVGTLFLGVASMHKLKRRAPAGTALVQSYETPAATDPEPPPEPADEPTLPTEPLDPEPAVVATAKPSATPAKASPPPPPLAPVRASAARPPPPARSAAAVMTASKPLPPRPDMNSRF
jgi:serine/threonine protein kinase